MYGNVVRQGLDGTASREDYAYDRLHRLVQSIRSGAASGTVDYGFDAVGNLTKKSDFSAGTAGAYAYTGGSCGGGPNAVKSVALPASVVRTYCYDANGNLTGDSAGLSLKYDHQNLVTVAERGALRDDFRYGPDGQRTRSWGSDGARVYLPGYEHRTDTGTTKVYVGDYAVVTHSGSTRTVEYLLKDRLGSVDAVANASGALTETRGYDAFGKPRSGTWNDLSPPKLGSVATTPKGYTQHEHLNQLELIHMNGRVYDYALGRFTGVDPFIQFPLNSQSLNPYSYILNNPLAGTDPTGYRSCILGVGSNAGCSTSEMMSGTMSYLTEQYSGEAWSVLAKFMSGPSSAIRDKGLVWQGTGAEVRKERLASNSEKGASLNQSACGDTASGGSAVSPSSEICESIGGCASSTSEEGRKFLRLTDGAAYATREGTVAAKNHVKENPEDALWLMPSAWMAKALTLFKGGGLFFKVGRATDNASELRTASAGFNFSVGSRTAKAANLPAWKKVTIDMEHVISGHTLGGARLIANKTLFPSYMSEAQIENAIRQAYRSSVRVRSQGENVLVRGSYQGKDGFFDLFAHEFGHFDGEAMISRSKSGWKITPSSMRESKAETWMNKIKSQRARSQTGE